MPSTVAASSMVGTAARTRRMCSISSSSSGTRRPTDLHRQVRQSDALACCEDHAALDGVAQLADVARPGMAAEGLAGLVGEAGERLAGLSREEAQQVVRQWQDVARALAQGRQRHLDDV